MATSVVVPAFRNGTAAIRRSTAAGSSCRHWTNIGVSVGPGATTLTRMPSGPLSWAAVRVKPMTACLVAWYAPSPVFPRNPPTLLVLTIDPPFSAHRADLLAQAQPGALDVHRHDPVEVLLRHLVERAVLVDAGVVERAVEPAEPGERVVDEPRDVGSDADVARGVGDVVTRRGELLGERGEGVPRPRGDHDGGPLLGEDPYGVGPDAGAPTDHEDDLPASSPVPGRVRLCVVGQGVCLSVLGVRGDACRVIRDWSDGRAGSSVAGRPSLPHAAAAADPSRPASLPSIVKAYPASIAARADRLVAAPALPIGLPAAVQALMAEAISATTRGSSSVPSPRRWTGPRLRRAARPRPSTAAIAPADRAAWALSICAMSTTSSWPKRRYSARSIAPQAPARLVEPTPLAPQRREADRPRGRLRLADRVHVRQHDPFGAGVQDALGDAAVQRGNPDDRRHRQMVRGADQAVRRLQVHRGVLQVDDDEVEAGQREQLDALHHRQLHPRAESGPAGPGQRGPEQAGACRGSWGRVVGRVEDPAGTGGEVLARRREDVDQLLVRADALGRVDGRRRDDA